MPCYRMSDWGSSERQDPAGAWSGHRREPWCHRREPADSWTARWATRSTTARRASPRRGHRRSACRPGARLCLRGQAAGALVGTTVEARAGRELGCDCAARPRVPSSGPPSKRVPAGSCGCDCCTAGAILFVEATWSSSVARITTAAAKASRAAIAMMSSARTRLKWERRTTDGCCAGIGCPMTASCVGTSASAAAPLIDWRPACGRRLPNGDGAVTGGKRQWPARRAG